MDELRRKLQTKLEPITGRELDALAVVFRRELDRDGITQKQWLVDHGFEGAEPTLSRILSGEAISKPIIRAMVEYIYD